jgi:hypothetical protein
MFWASLTAFSLPSANYTFDCDFALPHAGSD